MWIFLLTPALYFFITFLMQLRCSAGQAENWEAVGCFRDDNSHSTLPDNFFNPPLHFNDLWPELKPLADECSKEAEKKGYKMFGIQFHQECWGGQNGSLTYDKYGKTRNCRVGVDGYGVGQVFANFVYKRKAVDGGWSSWSNWTTCHVTCGGGDQRRTRTCTNPAPESGGKSCAGVNEERKKCNMRPCPVHGTWSEWTGWTSCHVTCGGGSQWRMRTCNKPQHGGKPCSGPEKESRNCNTRPCPVHGAWSAWSNLGQCSKSCGNGFQTRIRTCTNPRPSHGGRVCSGRNKIKISCRTSTCPVVRRFLLCEWHHGYIRCPGHQRIHVKYANYGRTAGRQICGLGFWFPTNCRAHSSHRIVSDRCRGRWQCYLQAKNWWFGDPCFGVYKYLEVHYTCE